MWQIFIARGLGESVIKTVQLQTAIKTGRKWKVEAEDKPMNISG